MHGLLPAIRDGVELHAVHLGLVPWDVDRRRATFAPWCDPRSGLHHASAGGTPSGREHPRAIRHCERRDFVRADVDCTRRVHPHRLDLRAAWARPPMGDAPDRLSALAVSATLTTLQ